jgi:hypothetical protein
MAKRLYVALVLIVVAAGGFAGVAYGPDAAQAETREHGADWGSVFLRGIVGGASDFAERWLREIVSYFDDADATGEQERGMLKTSLCPRSAFRRGTTYVKRRCQFSEGTSQWSTISTFTCAEVGTSVKPN